MNQNESRKQREREKVEDELDHELEQTFPGSDPLNITRSIPSSQITPKRSPPTQGEGQGSAADGCP
jgi:hypothetical protein